MALKDRARRDHIAKVRAMRANVKKPSKPVGIVGKYGYYPSSIEPNRLPKVRSFAKITLPKVSIQDTDQ